MATRKRVRGGEEGVLTFNVQRLAKSLLLKQKVVELKWLRAMFVGFIISCVVVPVLIWYVGYRVGASGQAATAPVAAQQQRVTSTPPSPQPRPQWSSYADCQRAYVLTIHQDPEGACDSLPH